MLTYLIALCTFAVLLTLIAIALTPLMLHSIDSNLQQVRKELREVAAEVARANHHLEVIAANLSPRAAVPGAFVSRATGDAATPPGGQTSAGMARQ
jgi:hypothetical protein